MLVIISISYVILCGIWWTTFQVGNKLVMYSKLFLIIGIVIVVLTQVLLQF